MKQTLRIAQDLLAYTIWADRTLLEALRAVGPEDLTRATGTSFGSIRGTLVHVLACEQAWLARFLGAPAPAPPAEEGFADRLALAMAFEEVWSQLEFFIASLAAEQLEGEVQWTDPEGNAQRRPFHKAVFHFVNHATFHRGQVVAMLRQMGYAPPGTDYIHFSRESGSAPPATC